MTAADGPRPLVFHTAAVRTSAVRAVVFCLAATLLGLGQVGSAAAMPADPEPVRAGARVVVDISDVPPSDAYRLAQALPEWEEAIAAGSAAVTINADELSELREAGFPVRVTGPAPDRPAFWPTCWTTKEDTFAWVAELEAAWPGFVEVVDFGDSYCKMEGGCRTPGDDRIQGSDLLVVRLTNEASVGPKQGRLWIDGGIHAREISATELMIAFTEYVLDAYEDQPQITYLLDHRELYVGVMINPDGRELVELGNSRAYDSGPWYWRKNAHEDPREECVWPPNIREHYGVDLNRNHGFAWDHPGHANHPCAETYRGRTAASEPETLAIESYWRSIFPDQRGEGEQAPAGLDTTGMVLSFHNATIPGLILYPYGHTSQPPPNNEGLMAIAERYVAPTDYDARRSIYATSGNARDWVYGELGVPAYVVELEGLDHLTPCNQFPKLLEDQYGPLTDMMTLADRPYERIRGPEVARFDMPGTAHIGDRVPIEALLDESRAGGDAVAGAEITIGMPGGGGSGGPHPGHGVDPGSGIALSPSDGAFDSALEEGSVELPTFGLRVGRHLVVARARDVHGHWGPPRAAFLDLTEAPTPVATATATPTPTATSTSTATSTATPTATSTATATLTPSATPIATDTPVVTPTPTPSSTPVPSATPAGSDIYLPRADSPRS